jgi:hypothetical protein
MWQDPPIYAIVARDPHAIHFRCAAPPTANPNKYADELLDAYLYVEDADPLYADYAPNGVGSSRSAQGFSGRNINSATAPQFSSEIQAVATLCPTLPIPHLAARQIQPSLAPSSENLLRRIHILLI